MIPTLVLLLQACQPEPTSPHPGGVDTGADSPPKDSERGDSTTDAETGWSETETGSRDSDPDTADSDTGHDDTDTGVTDSDTGAADTDTGRTDTDSVATDTETGSTSTDTEPDDTETGVTDTGAADTDSGLDTGPIDFETGAAETAGETRDSDSAAIDSGDSRPAETGSTADTSVDTDPGGDTAIIDTGPADTAPMIPTEVAGNGIDDDGDGNVDEFRDADVQPAYFAVAAAAPSADAGYAALWYPADATFAVGVISTPDLVAGDWLSDAYWVGAGDFVATKSTTWIGDVDGDGHGDLAASVDDPRDSGDLGTIYAWADVTTRDVDADEYIATYGDGYSSVSYLATLTLLDGSPALTWLDVWASARTIVIPISALADGAAPESDAIASITAYPTGQPDGPHPGADADGDGVDDLLMFSRDTDDATAPSAWALSLFLGTQLDTTGLVAADAAWLCDVTSDNPDQSAQSSLLTDVDGDGYADVVGVTIWADYSAGLTWYGTGFVVPGPLAGTTDWAAVTTQAPFPDGTEARDIALVGDVDGDSLSDVAWGLRGDRSGGSEPGRVEILLASTLAAGGTLDSATERWAVATGDYPDDGFGEYIHPDDFDGDGKMDLAVYQEGGFDELGVWQSSGSRVWFDVTTPG